MLSTITLSVMVGSLLKMNTPPPVIAFGGFPVPKSRKRPLPPRIVKPSRRSAGVGPLPKTTVAHVRLITLSTQLAVTQGLPSAAIVVTDGPSVEITLTPGNMRRDSL